MSRQIAVNNSTKYVCYVICFGIRALDFDFVRIRLPLIVQYMVIVEIRKLTHYLNNFLIIMTEVND